MKKLGWSMVLKVMIVVVFVILGVFGGNVMNL